MFLKFICCDVFARIACGLISMSPHIVDVEFVPMLTHNEPEKLRNIKKAIYLCLMRTTKSFMILLCLLRLILLQAISDIFRTNLLF